jgi:T-complex protein 1 subunit theta
VDAAAIPGSEKINMHDLGSGVANRLKCPLAAKQYGYEDVLAPLIAKACVSVCPKNPVNFNVDNVRTVKITGNALAPNLSSAQSTAPLRQVQCVKA